MIAQRKVLVTPHDMRTNFDINVEVLNAVTHAETICADLNDELAENITLREDVDDEFHIKLYHDDAVHPLRLQNFKGTGVAFRDDYYNAKEIHQLRLDGLL